MLDKEPMSLIQQSLNEVVNAELKALRDFRNAVLLREQAEHKLNTLGMCGDILANIDKAQQAPAEKAAAE